MSTVPLSGVNSRLFSAIPLSRFSLKKSRFFWRISSWKNCNLCALFSVKWNLDDSATSFPCSAKQIPTSNLENVVCFACLLSCDLVRTARARDKDIQGYRSSDKIPVLHWSISDVLRCAPWRWETILTPAFYAFSSALSRFFVRWCWHLWCHLVPQFVWLFDQWFSLTSSWCVT